MDSRSSGKSTRGTKKNRGRGGNFTENSNQRETEPGESKTAEAVRQERRKGHHIISAATYYRDERRGSGIYGIQDGVGGDTETDDKPYTEWDY